MAKAFSIISWNVEHFGAEDRLNSSATKDPGPIVDLIHQQDPDIIGIMEVRSDKVFRPLIETIPDHHFFITEGPQIQEILIGIRKTIPAFITQKTEFKAGQNTLRPGMLVTPFIDGQYYPILFLHVKSMPDPKGFGLRDDMIDKAFDFRLVLKKANGGQDANYIFLGDLNTMGLNYPGGRENVSGAEEVRQLRLSASRRAMRVLTKSHPATYFSHSYGPSNLDHLVAAKHMIFDGGNGRQVRVGGWVDQPTDAARDAWVAKFSDHAWLYTEVQQV
jgi:hypothetical protein